MTNIRINYEKETIEITKAYSKRAGIVGSAEYKELKEVKLDNPTFKIVVREASKKSNPSKNITYNKMKKYLKAIGDQEGLKELEERIENKRYSAKENAEKYNEIKKWFLDTYTTINKSA